MTRLSVRTGLSSCHHGSHSPSDHIPLLAQGIELPDDAIADVLCIFRLSDADHRLHMIPVMSEWTLSSQIVDFEGVSQSRKIMVKSLNNLLETPRAIPRND